jgi:glycosyltransferase involved in cell wall biosynthesis
MLTMLKEKTAQAERFVTVEKKARVSVLVPVFNEEEGIKNVIYEIQEILSTSELDYELVVIDDGSSDHSPEILKDMEGITYLRHPKNVGYGGALKTGIKNAEGDIIVITDGDGTYPNKIIPNLVDDMETYDMVVGARAKNDNNIALVRRPAKWFLGKLANYLAGTNIPDLNSGLRAFRKDAALRFYTMLPSGFSFTTTITLAMLCNDYKVKYVPIRYGKRQGKSKIKPIKDTLNFIQLIGRTVMYFNPLKIFLPIAGFVSMCLLTSILNDAIILQNLTDKTVMLFVALFQLLALGLLADLVVKRSS